MDLENMSTRVTRSIKRKQEFTGKIKNEIKKIGITSKQPTLSKESNKGNLLDPLLFGNILQNIFGYLQAKDLVMICGKVCHFWKEEVDRRIRTKGKEYKVDLGVMLSYPVELLIADSRIILTSLHVSRFHFDHKPLELTFKYHGFLIKSLTLQSGKVNISYLRKQLRNYLPNLETLILYNITYVGQIPVANQLFLDNFSLPNLKKLVINDPEADPKVSSKTLKHQVFFPTHIEDVARGCPNLAELEITYCPHEVIPKRRLSKNEIRSCTWSKSIKSIRLAAKEPWDPIMIKLFKDMGLTKCNGFRVGEKSVVTDKVDN